MKLKLDNPFFVAMERIGDMVLLNVTWVVCCLPVVTAGASTAALLSVARRLAAGEECRVWRDFFRAFRRSWRQATVTWLMLLAAGALFVADLFLSFRIPGGLGSLLRGTGTGLCIIWLAVAGSTFALTARYEYGPARVIADGALLALRNPMSALITVVMALWLPALFLYDPHTALYLLFPWLLAGGAVWALALSAALLPAFRALEEKKGDD